MEVKRKALLINEDLHKKLITYCKENGLVMMNLTEKIISEYLKKVVK